MLFLSCFSFWGGARGRIACLACQLFSDMLLPLLGGFPLWSSPKKVSFRGQYRRLGGIPGLPFRPHLLRLGQPFLGLASVLRAATPASLRAATPTLLRASALFREAALASSLAKLLKAEVFRSLGVPAVRQPPGRNPTSFCLFLEGFFESL